MRAHFAEESFGGSCHAPNPQRVPTAWGTFRESAAGHLATDPDGDSTGHRTAAVDSSPTLFWVSPEMQQTVTQANEGGTGLSVRKIVSLAPCGYVALAEPQFFPNTVLDRGDGLLVLGIWWTVRTSPHYGLALVFGIRAEISDAEMTLWGTKPEGSFGASSRWGTTDDWVVSWLACAAELMQTPTVAETQVEVARSKVRRKGRKKIYSEHDVTVVRMRPLRNEHQTHSPSGRKYTHRWVVRGHWRNQACGPKRSERRRIWVPAYTKGPDGAPLMKHAVVNAWVR